MAPPASFAELRHLYYINLERRADRRSRMDKQLSLVGWECVATRFSAIAMPNGAVGCTMSHLKLLENAAAAKLDHVLILEDDIAFLQPDVFRAQLDSFLRTRAAAAAGGATPSWDVLLLAGNNFPPYTPVDDTCIQVTHCQTTTGYLVNGHYIATLARNVRAGLERLLREPAKHSQYAIDMYWLQLQKAHRWFILTPLTVVQQSDYSDIERRVVNYEGIMQDLDKTEFMNRMRQRRAAAAAAASMTAQLPKTWR